MIIQTSDGKIINDLPEEAVCLRTGKPVRDMDVCPGAYYDPHGFLCLPEDCDEFQEDYDEI